MADLDALVPVTEPLSEEDARLFGDYRWLVSIIVGGEPHLVPDDNSVLRALQYLDLRAGVVEMEWGRFCWNDSTGCCEMSFREHPGAEVQIGRACRVPVRPRLEIVELPIGGRLCGPTKD